MRWVLLFFLLGCSVGFAQNTISGTVQADGEPLVFANVYLSGLSKGATTDQAGYFKLEDIPNGRHTVVVSFTGFGSQILATKGKGKTQFAQQRTEWHLWPIKSHWGTSWAFGGTKYLRPE